MPATDVPPPPPPLDREAERLAVLRQFGVLDTAAEAAFDELTALAAQLCDAPMALVSLVDADRQWFKARLGVDLCETSRDVSFCAHALQATSILEVPDARQDPRFADNPLVTGPPGIRFYAGAPLVAPGGLVLGTLCVLDVEPRHLGARQREQLTMLARQVVGQLELRRQTDALAEELAGRRSAEDALRSARDELEGRQVFTDALLASVDVGIVACDAEGRLTVFNDTCKRWHGIPQGFRPELGADPEGFPEAFDLLDGNGRPLPADEVPLLRALRDGVVEDAEMVISPHGHSATRVVCAGRRLTAPDGRSLGAVVAMTDVTAARAQTRALEVSEQRFRTTWDHDPAGLALLSSWATALQVNPALCRLAGREAHELVAPDDLLELLAEEDRDAVATLVGERMLAAPGSTARTESRLRRPRGDERWLLMTLTTLADQHDGTGVLLQVEDVTERRSAERRLAHQALHDPLTGLANRAALFGRVREALGRLPDPAGRHVAVLFCDLDGFKAVNDAHGHAAGDRVLVETGRRLAAALRPTDAVARFGGDEFVVLCDGVRAPEELGRIVARLEEAVAAPVAWEGGTLQVRTSVGVASTAEELDAEQLVRRADIAMYEVKRLRGARPPG